jgi:phage terminase large subunit-like protein
MKKAKEVASSGSELRVEYKREDFGKMTRGKHYKQVMQSSNVVVLNAEVAKAFPNATAVNEALGQLLNIAKTAVKQQSRVARARGKARTA